MTLGLVAVGDSITNGHNDTQARVPAMSWAQWLADSMDLSYTRYARGGATSTQIVAELLPRVRDQYLVGVFNMGTNDAHLNWDAAVFEHNVRTTAEALLARCEQVIVLTVAVSDEATAIVRRVAAELDMRVVDSSMSGSRLMRADHVHPSALGQLMIADRAADVLGVARPSLLASAGGKGRVGSAYRMNHAHEFAIHAAKRIARKVLR